MEITYVLSRLGIGAKTINGGAGIESNITVNLDAPEADAALNSLLIREFTSAQLAGLTASLDSFPNVELNGATAVGADGQVLLLNGVHVVGVQLRKTNDALPAVGFVKLTLTKLGGATAATRDMVAGDVFHETSALGWPADPASALSLQGSADLANVTTILTLAGTTVAIGTGYGYA